MFVYEKNIPGKGRIDFNKPVKSISDEGDLPNEGIVFKQLRQ